MSENAAQPFQEWLLLELFGHKKVAGLVTEKEIAGHAFLQVTIPPTADQPEYTRFYAPSAVYGMAPVTEDTARALAERYSEPPVTPYMLPAPRPEVLTEDVPFAVTVYGEDEEVE